MGTLLTPAASASVSGAGLAVTGVLLALLLNELRRFRQPAPQTAQSS